MRTVESPKTAAPAGVHRVAGGFNSAPQEEFEFADGRIIGHRNLKNPQAIDVKYNDGGTEVIGTVPTVQDRFEGPTTLPWLRSVALRRA